MIVVLDANIFLSALIAQHGFPAQILNLWLQRKFELAISSAIVNEVNRVVHYPRIRKKYVLPEEEVANYIDLISSAEFVVNPSVHLSVIEKDPSDDRYIECALVAKAEYMITGDSHLIELERYQGIQILTPASFIALLGYEGVR